MIPIPKAIKYIFILFAWAFIGVTLFSCGSSQPQKSNILYTRIESEPSTLNPVLTTDKYSSAIQSLIYNGLFTVDSELKIIPELAKSYSISSDNRTYTVHLNESVTWHDNQPFTAEDVKFTIDTYLSPSTNTVYRSNFIIDNQPIETRIIGTHQIQFILPKPFAPFLARLTTSIIPKHIFESKDINKNPNNREPIGTGPFIFNQWASGQFIRLKSNTQYFEGTPKVDQIIARVIPNDLTAIISLENKEIDESEIKPKDVKSLENDTHLATYSYEQMAYIYMGFNLKKPPFDSLYVRQAIAHAINKSLIVEKVLLNQGQVAHVPNHPISWAYPNKDTFSMFEYQPEKSRSLLEQEGYIYNATSGYMEKNNIPLTFTLILTKGNTVRENTAKIIQQYLQKVGIKMNIQLMEFQSLVTILKEPVAVKRFEVALLGWSLGLDPDSYSIWHSSQFPKGFNFIGYHNPNVDTLIIKGRQETNPVERKEIYTEMYAEITKDIPYIFLFYENTLHTVNKRVLGLSQPSPAGIFLNIEEISVQ